MGVVPICGMWSQSVVAVICITAWLWQMSQHATPSHLPILVPAICRVASSLVHAGLCFLFRIGVDAVAAGFVPTEEGGRCGLPTGGKAAALRV
jgi:hypothetical protein